MNEIVIDGVQIRIMDDFVVDEGLERWVGEYYFFPDGVCVQVFQEPVHGYYIKIEARSLDMLKTNKPTLNIGARDENVKMF